MELDRFFVEKTKFFARLRPRASEWQIGAALAVFQSTYMKFHHRVSDPGLESIGLASVVAHSDSLKDLENASRALAQGAEAANLYLTRTAIFLQTLDAVDASVSEPRASAHRQLKALDRLFKERGVFWHPLRREVVQAPLQLDVWETLGRLGISVSESPIAGMRFNAGLQFRMADLYPWEIIAAQFLSRLKPREVFLGLGDKSVRRFHRFSQKVNGQLNPNMPTADFLTVEILEGGLPAFGVRELKYKEPTSRVDVAAALAQLRSSAEQITSRHPRVPVNHLELILPVRGVFLNENYDRSELPIKDGESLYPLIHVLDGPVSVDLPQGKVPVHIRLMEFPER